MGENKLARLDAGEANRRILAKDESRTDFRRVENASVKRRTHLLSGEGKRTFARTFYGLQANVYYLSIIGRSKLTSDKITVIEEALRARIDAGRADIDGTIDEAEKLLKANNIEGAATYDTVALQEEVAITSALGRRFFELIHAMDQLMPLLQTLEIEEVITTKEFAERRSHAKRMVARVAILARRFADALRSQAELPGSDETGSTAVPVGNDDSSPVHHSAPRADVGLAESATESAAAGAEQIGAEALSDPASDQTANA